MILAEEYHRHTEDNCNQISEFDNQKVNVILFEAEIQRGTSVNKLLLTKHRKVNNREIF